MNRGGGNPSPSFPERKVARMFKPFEISLHRVHDRVKITENGESLALYVDGDPMRMVAGLAQAQKIMQGLNEESTEEEQKNAALYFADVIFGKQQAEKIMEFYHGDAGCVINVCGQYFSKRLNKLIVAAQKKQKK
jgi:hypothetical protein